MHGIHGAPGERPQQATETFTPAHDFSSSGHSSESAEVVSVPSSLLSAEEFDCVSEEDSSVSVEADSCSSEGKQPGISKKSKRA